MSIPKVAVILSSYNGGKYITEQIQSILKQKEVQVDIYIFDDCSQDNTIEIINNLKKENENIYLKINEKNKNYTYNFLDGLFNFKDSNKYDYYAFSDQDDFWMENKLIHAIEKIKDVGKCTLYSSNLRIVDRDLNDLGRNVKDDKYTFHKHDQIFYCLVTGCTAVMDSNFKDLVTKHYPKGLVYHDYWVGLIANYCKEAHYIYDNNPNYILYRQHGENASGGAVKRTLKDKILTLIKGHKQNFFILKLLLENFGQELNYDDKILIKKFIDYKKNKNKKYIIHHLDCSNAKRVNFKLIFNLYKDLKKDEM